MSAAPSAYPSAGYSHRGGKTVNEDAWGARAWPEGALYVVADGIGAYRGAEWGARFLVEAALAHTDSGERRACFADEPDAAMAALFTAAITRAGQRLAAEHPDIRPRTTAVMAWVGGRVVIAHLGDSRCYRFSAAGIGFRTRDHSLAQELVEHGALADADAAHHPAQRQLTKAVDFDQPATPDISVQPPLAAGEALLLCSDGVWGALRDDDLLALHRARHLDRAVRALVEAAVERAGRDADNATAIVVRAGAEGPPRGLLRWLRARPPRRRRH